MVPIDDKNAEVEADQLDDDILLVRPLPDELLAFYQTCKNW